ncbi:DUF3892 domain-containing protein [Tenacibaculum maritimum]|uniref:DUF3892 domain-containing protein n=1 Tax=Tenacibaculum maritimum TaxID=107401 RepID=UPI0012E60E86|nr:DUF3892 domain-containing protein [Tenacibaculum maritimum]CAA0146923.1 hypothetical protein TMFC_10003 [Tenacibaculum maritimum]
MATYGISGVWKDATGAITHYALHLIINKQTGKALKATKANVIRLLNNPKNTVSTLIWDYSSCNWKYGKTVHVATRNNDTYLRSDPNNQQTDNLKHLIHYLI